MAGGAGRRVAPQSIDQGVGRDDSVRFGQQHRQHQLLTRPAEAKPCTLAARSVVSIDHPQPPENLEAHTTIVRTVLRRRCDIARGNEAERLPFNGHGRQHLNGRSEVRRNSTTLPGLLRSCAPRRSVQTYNHMVVGQVPDADVDRIFHALADGTRRDIVALAVGGRYSVSALAKRYPMSFAAVQKHVAVLEGAGLVTKERRGREQLVRTDVDTVHRARVLLDGIEELWRARVDRIDDLLATEQRTTGGKR